MSHILHILSKLPAGLREAQGWVKAAYHGVNPDAAQRGRAIVMEKAGHLTDSVRALDPVTHRSLSQDFLTAAFARGLDGTADPLVKSWPDYFMAITCALNNVGESLDPVRQAPAVADLLRIGELVAAFSLWYAKQDVALADYFNAAGRDKDWPQMFYDMCADGKYTVPLYNAATQTRLSVPVHVRQGRSVMAHPGLR